jgi:NADH dehydrogenase FAD-containing subunit
MQNIVVLGGNFAGVGIAHYLLRDVLPLLNSTSNATEQYKVTLVSLSDHTYFNVATPRALSSPAKAPIDKLFTSIVKAFSSYKSSEFTFIHGEAVGVDENAKTVSIKGAGAANTTSVQYTSLVVATGSSADPVFKLNGEHTVSIAALEEMHKRIPHAKSIVVAGGGATGIEVAAEMAYFYPGIDVTLLSGTSRLLSRIKNTNVSKAAERKLAALKVKVVHNLRVKTATKVEDATKTALEFNDGSTRVVDIYFQATGGKVNSEFLPTSWLDISTNQVVTDGQTLRATNALAGIYAIGDVASYSNGGIPDATWSIPALGYSIWHDIHTGKVVSANGEEMKQGSSGSPANGPALKEKKYKQLESDMQVIPTGPKGGVGVMFGWSIPSWLVWLLKSRTFGIDHGQKIAAGR